MNRKEVLEIAGAAGLAALAGTGLAQPGSKTAAGQGGPGRALRR
jgi:hypothetical protein